MDNPEDEPGIDPFKSPKMKKIKNVNQDKNHPTLFRRNSQKNCVHLSKKTLREKCVDS